MLILDRAAARTSLSPSAAVDCCTSTFIGSSGACLARLACDARAITLGLAYTTSGIGLRSGRSSAGIARGSMSSRQLPALSTYLGHACVRDTYWYLSACPELMQEAARRLDRRWEVKP